MGQSPLQKWTSRRNWAKRQLLAMRTQLNSLIKSDALSAPEKVNIINAKADIGLVLTNWTTGQHVSRLEFLEKLLDLG